MLGLSTIGIDALRVRRIQKHLAFIARDDEMLLRDSTPLSLRALVEALEERGMYVACHSPFSFLTNLTSSFPSFFPFLGLCNVDGHPLT